MKGKSKTSFWRENGLFLVVASLGGAAILLLGGVFASKVIEKKQQEELAAAQEVVTEVADEETPTAAAAELVKYLSCELSSDSVEQDLNLYLTDDEENKIEGEKFTVKLVDPKDAEVLKGYVESINTLTDQIDKFLVLNKDKVSGLGEELKFTGTDEELKEISQLFEDKETAIEAYKLSLEAIKGEEYSDGDADGLIYIKTIKAGKYTACYVPANDYDPVSYTVDCEVKDKIEYKAATNIKKKVKVYVEKEDVKKQATTVEKELKDTVTIPAYEERKGKTTYEQASAVLLTAKVEGAASTSYTVKAGSALAETTQTEEKPKEENPTTPTTPSENGEGTGTGGNSGSSGSTEGGSEGGTDQGGNDGNSGGNNDNSTPGEPVAKAKKGSSTFSVKKVNAAELKYKADTVLTLSKVPQKIALYSVDGLRTVTFTVETASNDSTKPYSGEISAASNSDKVEVKVEGKNVTVTAKDTEADLKATVTVKSKTDGTNDMSLPVEVTVTGSKNPIKTAEGKELFADAEGKTAATVANYKSDGKYYIAKTTQTIKIGEYIENGKTYFHDANGNPITGDQVIHGQKVTLANDGSVITKGKGIDVSKFQGNINWSKVSTQVSYAIIRCGGRYIKTGELYEDPMFYTNMKGAKNAGMNVGIYFYSTALTEAEAVEEASLAVAMANAAGGCQLPIYIDMEDTSRGVSKLSNAQRTAIINAFCTTVANAGYKPGLYASKNWMEGKINAKDIPTNVNIWVARYNTELGYAGRYNMWQYTSSGRIDGISGNVDMNISY